jgi:asparagine synthase (glutamine-hydrolysing)
MEIVAVNGLLGWTGIGDHAGLTLATMAGREYSSPEARLASHQGDGFALAADGAAGAAGVFDHSGLLAAAYGHPTWRDGNRRLTGCDQVVPRLMEAFASNDVAALATLGGDYAIALLDPARMRLILAVDRMSIRNIVYAETGGGLVFGPSSDVVSAHPLVGREVDRQQIYNYLYFHMVPGPATAFRGQQRVPPGHYVDFSRGQCVVKPHWQARFAEDRHGDFEPLKREFRGALEASVRNYSSEAACGTFLSGGTDSSTIAGLLGEVSGAPARTFSIGFAEDGYDEMQFARITSRHFNTAQHEYYVTPQDVVEAVPRIANVYDQPFGNASAVPTYYCAQLARDHGVSRILGGDGGDELYGGNARYAKQRQFAFYDGIPGWLRHGLVEPVARNLPCSSQVSLLRKARSYIAQASLPMPDRYESYNLLERLGAANVLTSSFLDSVDQRRPLARLREVYAASDANSLINKMLALDFQFTLADNDLPKVTRMCELAGVDVAFPMLDEDVIDFSLRLAPDQKLRGRQLRYFFKEALRDFLPAETIAKEKHGFGLPVGAWLQRHDGLRALAGDTLATLRRRQIVRADFIDRLLDQHLAEHPGYYGTMVWVLMMLELWFQRHVNR